MLIIYHGDDIAKSRNAYIQDRQKYPEAIILQGDKVTMTDLVEAVEGQGLFVQEQPVFIEQFLSKNKKSKELDAMIAYLTSKSSMPLFLWESKTLDKKILSTFPQAVIKSYAYPQTLFQFLENLRPGNTKLLLQLFKQTLATTEIEIIFFMLVRQIRVLLALKSDTPIEETKRLASWQKSRLQKQVSFFTEKQLIHLYTRLYEIDLGAKTGTLALPLSSTIDIFLTEF